MQLEKVYASIDVTPSGMDIDVNDKQPENALHPIDVTLSGMDIDVRDEQL